MAILLGLIALGLAFSLLYHQASIRTWTLYYLIFALLIIEFHDVSVLDKWIIWAPFVVLLACTIKPLRQRLLTHWIFNVVKRQLPEMSRTEREALMAGTVGFEGDLFSGSPDFQKLLKDKPPSLREDEIAFLEGPLNELCAMINDWEITHQHTDLPKEMWDFIKAKGFLGMIIPKEFGGLELSVTAQMMVLVKLYGRSVAVATTVGVPNSLGPAELLLKYGTQEQKDYYLPRLASGQEIPCFALTGPNAGSDAASMPDVGVVCKQVINGKEEIGVLLNWDKRYITLCPVATVIGLAFRMHDPDNLLERGEDIGITCALIPQNTKGVTTGRRHFPLNTAFLNGPTQGKNVFITFDKLIGGIEMAGMGWRMLMECLSAGRAISLPSSASGGISVGALASGAYARVRRQFNQPIAKFEGIEEPLARIAGHAYIVDSALTVTAHAIDRGEHPAVAGAILKYHTTERSRLVAMDAMDIHGGKGICLGPKNYLGRGYQSAPIGITVEGANILTRSLIIFGQGAVRCHPYVLKEMEAAVDNDLPAFDKAFWAHAAYFMSNTIKTIVFGWTNARGVKVPDSRLKGYYQSAIRFSANLAFLADFSMMMLGGSLKRKEKISARLGDILSYLYLMSCVMKRYHDDGEPATDLPLVHWALKSLLYECEAAIRGIITNFPIKGLRVVLRLMLMPLGSQYHKPQDELGAVVARILTMHNETRSRLGRLAYQEANSNCPFGQLIHAFDKVCEHAHLEDRVVKAFKKGELSSLTLMGQIEEAKAKGLLTKEEAKALKAVEVLRQEVIAVDDFSDDELRRPAPKKGKKAQE